MPRKRREEVHGEPKKPTRYDDKTPHWMRALVEEDEEFAEVVPGERRWHAPKRVRLEFSTKDARKEEQRHAAIQKKRRTDSRR